MAKEMMLYIKNNILRRTENEEEESVVKIVGGFVVRLYAFFVCGL